MSETLFIQPGQRVNYDSRSATVIDVVGVRAMIQFDRTRCKWHTDDDLTVWVRRDSDRFAPAEKMVAPLTLPTLLDPFLNPTTGA